MTTKTRSKTKTTKDEEQEDDEDECCDEDETDQFKVYMEAEGAKGTNKFWEVTVDDCDMTTRYGKAGSDGQSSTKSFDDHEAAMKAAEKLIKTKEKGGYSRVDDEDDEQDEPEDDEEENEDEDEDEASDLTTDQVTIWFLPVAKGGLKMAELKEKAEAYGVNVKGLKKDEIKNALMAMCSANEFLAEDNDEDESEAESECQFVYTKGPQKGSKCSTKPKDGADFCGKHKDCKAAKKASGETSESEEETPAPKKAAKGKGKMAIKPASSGKCLYVPTRGPQKGKQCDIKPKDGESFCAKHANTQQAVQYKANDSPAAKKAAKKASAKEEESEAPSVAVKRHKELKVWVIDGHNLVVKSPKNKMVTAYVTKKGTVSKTLNAAAKTLAEELGLEIEG